MSLLKPSESAPLQRRDFVKLVLVGSAGIAAASCRKQTRAVAPLLIPEERLVPGVAYWSRGLCTQCDAGCGVLVKRMETVVPLTIKGKSFRQSRLVAKKLEGNPDHPLNRGGLCARGQAALEVTYHPMRLIEPLRRTGARGSGLFRPVTWTEAMAALRREVTTVPAGAIAWLGRPLRGTEGELVGDVMRRVGSRWWEYQALPAPRAEADAARLARLSEADFMLSFANFLESWPAQAPTTRAYSRFRRGRRGVFFQVEPRMSLTASNADRWIAARPGTEGVFALGVAAALLAMHPERFHSDGIPSAPTGLASYTPAAVRRVCDVPASAVGETARALAGAKAPLVVGGPEVYACSNGAFNQRAIRFLAALVDASAARALESAPEDVAVPRGQVAMAEPEGDARLIATAFSAPLPDPPRLLIVHEANPVFSAPPGWNLTAWLRSIPTIVALGTLPDETALQADLVLPLSTTLEAWTDDERTAADGRLVATLNPPAMRPLHDTRSLLQIVSELDQRPISPESTAGSGDLPDEEAPPAALQRHWQQLQKVHAPRLNFSEFWTAAVARGGFWTPGSVAGAAPAVLSRRRERLTPAGDVTAAVPPPASEPPTQDYPLHLRLYESSLWGDGRGSWLTWLQELPDPTTSAMWSSWVEVHPQLAASLGLDQGDGVWVESSVGRIELPVFLYPGTRTDTVAIPTGQGHRAGDTVTNRGANPFELLIAERDEETGALAWEATRVRLRPSGRRPALPLFGRSLQHPVTHR